MSAFAASGFSTAAFSRNAFDFGIASTPEAGGGGFFEYPMRRRPLKELETTEPAIAKEIEALALKGARSDERALSAAQLQAHLDSVGLAYEQAYQQIYLGLIQEIEQEQEFEAIATCMAALL